jgi:hypothetical protein
MMDLQSGTMARDSLEPSQEVLWKGSTTTKMLPTLQSMPAPPDMTKDSNHFWDFFSV